MRTIRITASGNRWDWAATAGVALALAASAAAGSVPTLAECLEGADFIANAAIARENGISRAAFLERLEDDLQLIHAFPAELRWFAKDDEDERFLHAEAATVFDAPATPEDHRRTFLRACFARLEV